MATSDRSLTLPGLKAQTHARLKRQARRERVSVNALLVKLVKLWTVGAPTRLSALSVFHDPDALARGRPPSSGRRLNHSLP